MNVELIGGGFVNKGGELMTVAAREMVKAWNPAHRLYMPLNAGTRSERAAAGFGTALQLDSNRLPLIRRLLLASGRVTPRNRWLIAESDVDVVLDISGFAYSDSWGSRTAARRAASYRRLRKRGATIVLMPQAFGPFTDETIRAAVRSLISTASLVFARDPVSLHYLQELGDLPTSVHCAPDFTNLLVPEEDGSAPALPAPVTVVPNVRMLDKTDDDESANYLNFMKICIEHLAESVGSYILIHETRDYELAQQIAGSVRVPVEVVVETDPMMLKRYLGASSFVVGSRYHALVSALSQGVPVLAAGWSHKYETLLDEYDQAHNLMPVDAAVSTIVDRLDELSSDAVSSRGRSELEAAAVVQKGRSDAMWIEVQRATGL